MLRVAEHGISLEETRKLNAVVLVCADVCTLCAKKVLKCCVFQRTDDDASVHDQVLW